MPRISDDHFASIPGAGPKRVQERPIVRPGHTGRGWWVILGLLALVAGGGWAWWAGWFAGSPVSDLKEVRAKPVAAMPAPVVVAVAAPVAVVPIVEPVERLEVIPAAPVGDSMAIARQRRALTERVENLGNGLASIERGAVGFRAELAPLVAQVDDAAAMHWPKPTGHDTYENYLVKLRDAARAKGDAHLAFTIEGQWQTFRDNRAKTLREVERLQGLIDGAEKRIAATKAQQAAAHGELDALR